MPTRSRYFRPPHHVLFFCLLSICIPAFFWGCAGTGPQPSASAGTSSGRIPGAVYDEAGNIIYLPPGASAPPSSSGSAGYEPPSEYDPYDRDIYAEDGSQTGEYENSPSSDTPDATGASDESESPEPKGPVRLGESDTASAPSSTPSGDPHLASAIAPLLTEAEDHLADGRPDLALSPAERAVRIHPKSPRVWNLLARIRFASGEDAQAEQMARKSILLSGANKGLQADNWYLMADIYDRAGKSDAATRARKKAASLAANSGAAG